LDPIVFVFGFMISLSFGTSDFLSKGVTARISAYKITVYILALSGVITLFPGLFLKSSFSVTLPSVLLLVFIAVTTCLSFVALYRAYSKGMLSLTAPIANSYPAFSTLLSVLLIGASFSLGSIAALITVVAGIFLVSTSFSDLRTRLFGRGNALAPGVGSAIVAALFFGASWTAFGYASQTFGFLLPAIAIRLGAAAVGFGLAPIFKQDVRPVFVGSLPRLSIMAGLEAAGAILFSVAAIAASSPDAIPILSTFSGISAAFTVCLAIVFLKERLELNHILGIIMLIGGVVVLLYLTG
jgi:drug/metabolite transporter (DMT)-like permease